MGNVSATGVIDFSSLDAKWVERLMSGRGWLNAESVPQSVAARLVEIGVARWIGPSLFITAAGINALAWHRIVRRQKGRRSY